MIVGRAHRHSRRIVVGGIGVWLTPGCARTAGSTPAHPFRKIGFIVALGMIMGAAIVDMALLAGRGGRARSARDQGGRAGGGLEADRQRACCRRGWRSGALAIVVDGRRASCTCRCCSCSSPIALVSSSCMVNGISLGISDSNPISSAFVLTVFIMAALRPARTRSPGLLCAAILLIATSVGGDMQQDRSTGWRLGTNRVDPVPLPGDRHRDGRGAGVVLAQAVHEAPTRCCGRPVRAPRHARRREVAVGDDLQVRRRAQGLTHPKPYVMTALGIGIGIGLLTEVMSEGRARCRVGARS